jgi:hypothetical protein
MTYHVLGINMAWKIKKNSNNSTEHDNRMTDAEGVYPYLADAMGAVARFELVTCPDGSMHVYDPDCEGIAEDIAGYSSLATISKVDD